MQWVFLKCRMGLSWRFIHAMMARFGGVPLTNDTVFTGEVGCVFDCKKILEVWGLET